MLVCSHVASMAVALPRISIGHAGACIYLLALSVRSLFAAIIQRLAGLSMGLIEMTLLKFYTYVVESAPHDSWPVFAFSRLANGPLKCGNTCSGCFR